MTDPRVRSHRGLLIVALLLAGSFAFGYLSHRTPKPLPPLPPDVVTIEVVKKIEVPGPERVVERVKWRTKEVQVPYPVTNEIIRTIREDPTLDSLTARGIVDATKYVGTTADGKVAEGWKGRMFCDLSLDGGATWHRLTDEPFDLSESTAVSVRPPVERAWPRLELRLGVSTVTSLRAGATWYPWRHVGWWGEADWILDPASGFDYSTESFVSGDSVDLALGVAVRW